MLDLINVNLIILSDAPHSSSEAAGTVVVGAPEYQQQSYFSIEAEKSVPLVW